MLCLLVSQCIVLTTQFHGCETLGGYSTIKKGNTCWQHFKFIFEDCKGQCQQSAGVGTMLC